MTPFEYAWEVIQEFETPGTRGTIVDDPNDPGGVTRYGFAQRWHPDIDVRMLSEPQAKSRFREKYWDLCRCDDLPARVAIAMADSAFGPEGPSRAIRALQHAAGAVADGKMGPKTIAAVHSKEEERFLNDFLSWRLVDHSEAKAMYRRGLYVRVLMLKDLIAEYSEGG